MSVVNMIIHDSFALLMGDTKLNDNPNSDHINKVFKKDNILLGYTGRLRDVREYLHPIFTADMQLNQNITWGEPDNPLGFIKYLDDLFYDALKNNKIYDIKFVVATKIGDKYIGKHYCIFSPEHPQWANDTFVSSDEYHCTYLGDTVHYNFFANLFTTTSISTLEDFQKIFQDTLDYGIKYDKTINNEMEWFVI